MKVSAVRLDSYVQLANGRFAARTRSRDMCGTTQWKLRLLLCYLGKFLARFLVLSVQVEC